MIFTPSITFQYRVCLFFVHMSLWNEIQLFLHEQINNKKSMQGYNNSIQSKDWFFSH